MGELGFRVVETSGTLARPLTRPTSLEAGSRVGRFLRACVLFGLLALVAGGCASDGKELAEPLPSQTTTTRPPPPTSAPPQAESQSGVNLNSPDFAPGADIPAMATCAGDNVFPNLTWTSVPDDTVELALSLSDQTDPAEPLLLWLMAGIDPDVTSLQQGTQPPGAYETLNDYGNLGYGTPCLESFSNGIRDLQFRLYILPQSSGTAEADPGNEAWSQIRARAGESATLLAKVNAVAS